MADARWVDDHVAGAHFDRAALVAAVADAGMAARDAQDFVGPGVKVIVGIDAVAPGG